MADSLTAALLAQDASGKQLQPARAKIKRKSMKPLAVQSAVIARSAIGDSKTQIAQDLGITRGTVYSILNSSEIEQEQLIGRSRCIRLIPTSVDVIEKRLEKGSETAALAILRGTNVLMNQALTVNQNNIQANTWITMRAQRSNEETQLAIEVKPDEKSAE